MSDSTTENLFSVPVNVKRLSKKGTTLTYEAPEDVRAAMAETYELLAVETFQAHAMVVPWRKNGVKVVGEVRGDLIQPCAITLDPLNTTVVESIDALYVPEGSKLALPKLDGEGEIVVDPEAPDLPETFTGDTLDLAGIWLEFFSLGLDPFAHKEGAELPNSMDDESDSEENASPFAVLAALKKH